MKFLLTSAAVLAAAAAISDLEMPATTPVGVDPAALCIGCTMVLALLEEAQVPRLQELLIDNLCDDSVACKAGVKELMVQLETFANPDDLCVDLKLCTGECSLFEDNWPVKDLPDAPPKSEFGGSRLLRAGLSEGRAEVAAALAKLSRPGFMSQWKTVASMMAGAMTGSGIEVPEESVAAAAAVGDLNPCGSDVECMISRVFDDHNALMDSDGDDFAPANGGLFGETMRGAMWRGADCNDQDGNVYPGRNPASGDYDLSVDSNCNGIFGGNDTATYEELFCADTPQRGLVILGDSATAHFHIPPQWLTADGWDLQYLIPDAANELDVPACSWGTGFIDGDHCPYATVTPVQSLYERFRERNRCVHRDFQNVGVNGARVTSSMGLATSMSRDAANDIPLTVIMSLIGNDVCNGHSPTIDHMTTVDEFRTNAQETFEYLDTVLPPDSAVVTVGLVDGRVLYQTTNDQTHPTGATYPSVYDFLTCQEENPCNGWLSSNETLRNLTTERAQNLTAVYTELVDEQAYTNFKLYTIDPDWQSFMADYVDQGGNAIDLIERVDGFHPSTAANHLLAEDMWQIFESDMPEILGAVNPHNDEIEAMFGDQGGY